MLTTVSRRLVPSSSTSSRTVRYVVTSSICVCRCFSSLSLSRSHPLLTSFSPSPPLPRPRPRPRPRPHPHHRIPPSSTSTSSSFPARSFATTNDPNVASKEGNRAKFAFTMEGVTKKLAGGRTLFSNINLAFLDGAKIGILGSNGSGKSSLLRIIAGVDPDYDGTAYAHPGFKIGYLAQEPVLDPTKTVAENVLEGIQHKQQLLTRYDEIAQEFANPDADMDALATEQSTLQAEIDHLNCWDLQHKVEIAMDALRCPPGHLPVTNLSGGEKRRVALCRLLLSEPDVLLLDEPTNHLDAMSVAWLEQYLDQYRGLVIAITHDRYFLDKVAGYILEIAEGYLYPFKGNYATWLEAKAKRQEMTKKRNAAQDKMMERELAWLRQNSSGQRTKSKARIRSFEQLEEERAARKANKKIEGGAMLIPEGPRLGQLVIQAHNLSLKHPDEDDYLFENVSFQLQRGHIMGVIGPNGSGKSTLLKLLVGERQAAGGTLKIGETVIFGYNSQTREQLNPDNMIWQEICGTQEFVQITNDYTMLSRAYVAQFNFSGTEQQKRIKNLSGGERNRVHLAKSLAKGCNVILLDEPTNDLDVDTLRSLEEALVDFEGAAIVVSHDRWFLDRVCTDILSFEEDGTVMYVEGNFTEYERTKRSRGGDMTPKKAKFKKLVQ